MKKGLLSVLGLAMVFGLAVQSHAATTSLNWNITVTFAADPIDISATIDPMTFGNVGASQNVFSNFAGGNPRSTLQNNGFATINYTALATCATGWSLASTLGGNSADNTCVLAAVFTAAVIEADSAFPAGRDLVIGNFGNEDVLGVVAQTASATALAIDNGSGGVAGEDALIVKGTNVAPTNSIRSLRYVLQTPPTVSGAGLNAQTMVVTIGATVI